MSDGGFNIGFAFAHVDVQRPGVYLCVGASVFEPNDAIDYLREGRFTSIFSGNASHVSPTS